MALAGQSFSGVKGVALGAVAALGIVLLAVFFLPRAPAPEGPTEPLAVAGGTASETDAATTPDTGEAASAESATAPDDSAEPAETASAEAASTAAAPLQKPGFGDVRIEDAEDGVG